jgi:hypothetical protein
MAGDEFAARLARDAEGGDEDGALLPHGTLPLFRPEEGAKQMSNLPFKARTSNPGPPALNPFPHPRTNRWRVPSAPWNQRTAPVLTPWIKRHYLAC